MSKVLVLLAVAPLAACTTDTSVTPLASFHDATLSLEITNDAQLIEPGVVPAYTRLTLSPAAGDCVRVGDDVTADLDGVRMKVESRGGEWSAIDANGCDLVRFSLPEVLPTRGASTLLVRDSATTWTITGTNLFANDFALVDAPVAGRQARVAWNGADSVEDGTYVQFEQNGTVMFDVYDPSQLTTIGNVIGIALPADVSGAGTLSLNASHQPAATRCDGPATCALLVHGGADLTTTIAPASPDPRSGAVTAVGVAQ